MKIRVGYCDTDQMGFVHHSNYVKYYEAARWDLLRKLGIPYAEIEKSGVLMPVIDMQFNFLRPARYDDLLTIKTRIKKITAARIEFAYEMYNALNQIINEASITLAFIKKATLRVCHPPNELKEKILAGSSQTHVTHYRS